MKAGWEVKRLGDVCRPQKTKNSSEHAPYVGLEDLIANAGGFTGSYEPKTVKSDTFLFDASHVLYGRLRPYLNKVFLPSFEGHCSTEIFPLLPFDNLSRYYLYYWLISASTVSKINETSTGTRMPRANVNALMKFQIPLPPLEEQQRIVSILDEAFEGLDRARENAEANLESARELFEVANSSLFSKAAKTCPFKTLYSVANLARGHNPPKKDFIHEPRKGYVRFYQIRDRKTDKHAVYVPNTKKLHTVNPSEILMTAYRHIGEVFRGAAGAFNVALCKLSSRDEEVLLNDYLFAIIPTDHVKGELLRHSERSLIPSMSIKHLQSIEIPLPTTEKQYEIVQKSRQLEEANLKSRLIYNAKLQDISDLRQSLLQKAFAGELT